jgi:uncharacterized protein
MRNNPLQFYIIVTIVILAIDLYVFQAFRTAFRDSAPSTQSLVKFLYWGFTSVVLLSIYSTVFMEMFHKPNAFRTYFFAVMLLLTVSKLFIVIFLLTDDLGRIARWVFSLFQPESERLAGMPISRLKFISQLGIFIGLMPFVFGVHGMISNAYNYQFRRIRLKLPNLPDAFKGLKIIQLSDIHSGSFTATEPIMRAIEKINNEQPDLIFFTGDLVNNVAKEMEPYIDIFSKLQAKEGVYSILGNHDYGDYMRWEHPDDKLKNFEYLKDIQKQMGWNLLLDENRLLQRGNDSLAIIGVQNWSSKMRFPKYGDLAKAVRGTETASVKLLLSHDPSHWDAQVCTEYPDIDATFSGHTHGAQFGVEIPGFKWSPSQYFYEQWAGLYQKANRYLYVNRGFGFIGYPGRVGILPEVTIFELHKA